MPQARAPFEGLPHDQVVVRLERMGDGSILVESQDMTISVITERGGRAEEALASSSKAYAVAERGKAGGFRILRLVADRRW